MGGPVVELPTISEAEWRRDFDRTLKEWRRRLPLPSPWEEHPELSRGAFEGLRYAVEPLNRLVVAFSAGLHDGRWWLHVSVSHHVRIPCYRELAEVKRVFVGDDLQALQIFPKAEQHVNIHPRCLHLWACLEPGADGLPNFGSHGTI